jgi:transcriptional regulator with XRE-family HTH domain
MEDRASAVGRRVRYWRQRRNLDRKQLADMVGRSTSWLDKIEKGERSLLRLPMLERVAEVLSIDPSVLTDSEVARSTAQCADVVEVQAIKKALGRYPTLIAHKNDMASVTMRQVDRQLDYAGHAWLSSHFTTVARVLPQLLDDAQLSAAADAHQKTYRALVMAYRLACSMLLKYDSNDIAWLAADRAMYTAQLSGDTIALARATRCVARAMSHTDQLDASVTVATDMADLLRPRLSHDDRDAVPLYGMLLLSAEITAARQGNGALAQSLHEEASAAASRIGSAHHGHHTFFGVPNVEVHRVSALVRLYEGGRAVRHAERIDPTLIAGLPTERRSNFLLDLTDAHIQTGDHRMAIQLLTEADHLAPEEVRCRPLARRLITALLSTAPGGADPRLRHIARRAGVTA